MMRGAVAVCSLSWRVRSLALMTAAMLGVLFALVFGAGRAAAGALSSLGAGSEIDVRSCTYGPGETHAGLDGADRCGIPTPPQQAAFIA